MSIPLLRHFASPRHCYLLAGRLLPWFSVGTLAAFAVGLYLALVAAPPDYQQGEGYRILYVHVPAAWMSLFSYLVVAGAGAIHLVWRVKLADVVAAGAAPLGALFTALALVTGALWGKPMWGTWWVWDARLTSELILLFLYLGYLGLRSAIEEPRAAARASALLALVGVVNIPVIHFSVEWWNTLHQGPSLLRPDGPTLAPAMVAALLCMLLAFKGYFATSLLLRVRGELLAREGRSGWVRELAGGTSGKACAPHGGPGG